MRSTRIRAREGGRCREARLIGQQSWAFSGVELDDERLLKHQSRFAIAMIWRGLAD